MTMHIVFTGGGTAGHVIPNLALIEYFQGEQAIMRYIGSEQGIERSLLQDFPEVAYYPIATGKLRRYASLRNFTDPFRVVKGFIQAYRFLKKCKPDVVFSKGGFVAVPVVMAARLLGIPVVAHESDSTPGLANRISFPFVRFLCLTFEQARGGFKHPEKLRVTGTPLRKALFAGQASQGLSIAGFDGKKPVLLVVGGSLGAQFINKTLRESLSALITRFDVLHICGAGKVDSRLKEVEGYKQYEFVKETLPHFFAMASVVVSRAGANSVYELLALQKPHIFIPLSMASSRGDQLFNARHFASQGVSVVLEEEICNPGTLVRAVEDTYARRGQLIERMKGLDIGSGTEAVVAVMKEAVKHA